MTRKRWPYYLASALVWLGISLVLKTVNIDMRNWQWWVILLGYNVYVVVFALMVDE